LILLVPEGGIEPPLSQGQLDFESSASTSFTTPAYFVISTIYALFSAPEKPNFYMTLPIAVVSGIAASACFKQDPSANQKISYHRFLPFCKPLSTLSGLFILFIISRKTYGSPETCRDFANTSSLRKIFLHVTSAGCPCWQNG
jgi:hypothetical protein